MKISEKTDTLKSRLENIFSSNLEEYSNTASSLIIDSILEFLDSDIECNLFNIPGVITTGLTVPPFTATGECYFLGENSFTQNDEILMKKCLGFFSTSNSFSYGKKNLRLSNKQDLSFYTEVFSEFLYDFFASSKFQGKFLAINPLNAVPSIEGTLIGLIQYNLSSSGLNQNRDKFISQLSSIINTPESNLNITSQKWYDLLNSIKNSIKLEASIDINIPSIYDPTTLSGTYITNNITVEATII